MKQFEVLIGRSRREYVTVRVAAKSSAAAQERVKALIDVGFDSQEYCDLINDGDLSNGDLFEDEEVLEVNEVKTKRTK